MSETIGYTQDQKDLMGAIQDDMWECLIGTISKNAKELMILQGPGLNMALNILSNFTATFLISIRKVGEPKIDTIKIFDECTMHIKKILEEDLSSMPVE